MREGELPGTHPQTDLGASAAAWLSAFEATLASGDPAGVSALFVPDDAHWRDVLAFTWDLRTFSGTAAITAMLEQTMARTSARALRLPAGRTPPRRVERAGRSVIEVIFEFETATGTGNGVVRLLEAPDAPSGWRAWTLVTTLEQIRGHEDALKRQRQDAEYYSRDFGAENWQDKRDRARAFDDRDPAALVIGGGPAGLAAAARLSQLGVDTLIIDREARIGDNWRRRYHSLTLHNEVHVNHMPYMPFPPTWPVFIPKDKLANWFEAYVESLDLNLWTGTELVSGDHDANAGHWRVVLRRADGSEREMRPRHLVFATGVSGIPVMPELPGLEDFGGTVMHSGSFTDGRSWKDRRALVLGTGNSGHDVAQDLHASGARVSMIQRSPTYIVSLPQAQKVYSIYNEGPSVEDCDLIATATPYPAMVRAYQLSTEEMRQADKPLLDALAARGFKLDFGEDHTGFQMKYLRRGGGYYFNVGCSDLIARGEVGLLQYDDIERFEADGLRMKDGRLVAADLLVTATGFLNQREIVRRHLGDAVADRIGPVWGFDAGGELANMWRRTPQPGLWFTAGSLAQCRIYSRYLALQIKACEEGLIAPTTS
ncbi:MAG: NAD(P)/FAD-dependent oxidoreductase [Burkholderiaceae bacterium]